MANKKVSQLTSKPSVLVTDLFPIADPSTGQLYKTTISDLGTAIGSGVSSVNTLVGAVVLDTDDIQELVSPTNKWFTDTRARAALSASSPLTYNSGTGAFGIQVANGSQNGYLSSTDWTTFNSKQAALSGTGFVKISGTTISYDNSTYLTTSAAASTYLTISNAASTYLALTGGTLTGKLTISASTMGAQINGGTFNLGDATSYALGVANGGGQDLTLGTSSTYANINTWSSKPLVLQGSGTNKVGIATLTPVATLDVGGTSAMKIPVGNTSERPASGSSYAGMVRFNSLTNLPEWWDSTISFWRPFGANSFYSELLIVAGGGGGGVDISGGGGAGGVIAKSDGYALSLNVTYTITLGAGGANATNGSNSIACGLVAIGGGRGGEYGVNNAGSGGSGGGGGAQSQPGGAGTSSQGNSGGSGTYGGGLGAGGGGGGAGAAGASATYTTAGVGGNGGAGISNSITGTATNYAGGGGGGQRNFTTSATGGTGGGGAGGNSSNYQGQSGTANTGGGGGGHGANGNSSSGGSGIIIIKCPNNFTAIFSAGITYSLSTSVLNHKVYTVTAGTGTVSFY